MADGGLRQLFRTKLPHFDWTTVEIGLASRGVPDLNGCFAGIEVWVELKQCAHWRILVRPEQVGWAERRAEHGGRTFVAVRRTLDELWLYLGSDLRRLKTERLDAVKPLYHGLGGPSRWDWDRVGEILIK